MPKNRPISTNLKPDHRVTLFPSIGYFDAQRDTWRILVHGRVFAPDKVPISTRLLLGGLKRAMKATPEEYASEVFQNRIGGFLCKPIARRRIVLQINGQTFRLKRRSRGDGVFFGSLNIDSSEFENGVRVSVDGPERSALNLQIVRNEGNDIQETGVVHLVNSHGVSVISDIDDTIKETDATSRREMLANTFLRPFAAVDGMAEVYQRWQLLGTEFHYVSSSPWQLYHPLSELCKLSGFPNGSMHLRYFCLRDEVFRKLRPVRTNKKLGVIAAILKRLPDRRYILIGDSGEKDPEIYRFLARRYKKQIAAVLIRDLPARPLNARRLAKLHSIGDHCLVRVYREAAEIANVANRYA